MKIFVQNISSKVTANSIGAVFSTYGRVLSTTIFSDATTVADDSRTALVIMPNEEEAAKAIEQLNGCYIDGYALAVMIAQPEKEQPLLAFYKRVLHYLSPKEKAVIL